jgi:CSLREA domain-containing protein
LSARAFRRGWERRAAADRRREQLRLRRAGLVAGAAIGALAVAPAAAQATDFEVNTLADTAPNPSPGACTTDPNGCTLREAINDANGNSAHDQITFASNLSGTVELTLGRLDVLTDSNGLSIDGGGRITISGDIDATAGLSPGDTQLIYIQTGPVTLSNLTLTGGYAAGSPGPADHGGAINAWEQSVHLTLNNDVVSGNHANLGGGVYSYGQLDVNNSEITQNTATIGGGINRDGKYSPMHLTGSVISHNSAQTGGGIDAGVNSGPGEAPASSEILNTTISDNDAADVGAGIHIGALNEGDEFVISHSTVSGNDGASASFGGGIDITGTLDGDVSMIDSTVAGNRADVGGGVSLGDSTQLPLVSGTGSVAIANSTIASNTAAVQGGGLFLGKYSYDSGYGSATVPVNSSIVAGNTAAGSPNDLDRADSSTGGAFDLSFSLVQTTGDAPVTQTPAGSSILGADPQLGGLASNGGPTLTMLLAPTSPAVDKGFAQEDLSTDQRGAPRTIDLSAANAQDGTDIGAVEINQNPPVPAPPAKKKPKCKKKHKKKHKRSADSAKKKHKKCKKKHKKKRH